MKLALVAISAALLLGGIHATASALDLNVTFGPRELREAVPAPPNAKIIIVDPMRQINEDRDAAWIRDCEPWVVVGADGVARYTYKQPGCEYGALPGTTWKVR